jgi:hypothetical protein
MLALTILTAVVSLEKKKTKQKQGEAASHLLRNQGLVGDLYWAKTGQ